MAADESPSLYDLLQAKSDASADEIKIAFKRRALEVHPDKGGSKEEFHHVYQAFVTLFDPKSRQAYDERLTHKRPRVRTTPATPGSEKTGVKPVAVKNLTRLMMRIHHLLQRVPREVRLEVISQEFSQKQRVLLQQWMTDEEQKAARPTSSTGASGRPGRAKRSCRTKRTTRKKSFSGLKGVSSAGGNGGYRASARIEFVDIYSLCIDLPTALENLAILLSAKHKMQEREGHFEERLKQALESSAAEQGKRLEELRARFRLELPRAGMLIGDHVVVSPVVRSFSTLGRLRALIEKESCRGVSGRTMSNIYAQFSPCELEDQWEEFQKTIAEMFHIADSDGRAHLCKVRSWYEAHEPIRQKKLRRWERDCMAKQDKGKHVPKNLRKLWYNRSRRAGRAGSCAKISAKDAFAELKELLARWSRLLEVQSKDLEKQRRKILQQRERERKAQRQAFLRRMRDPHLTMDDILGPSRQSV
eukprot:Skav203914  [mRNA]  locus=scaffold228:253752:255173:- [translate_table: standard]